MKKTLLTIGLTLTSGIAFAQFMQGPINCDTLADCQSKLSYDTASYVQLNATHNQEASLYDFNSRKKQAVIDADNVAITNLQLNNSK